MAIKKKASKKKFTYTPLTREGVRKAKQSSTEYDSMFKREFQVWSPKEGLNKVRIMQATWEGADNWGYKIHCVYGIGPDDTSYLSLSKMGQGKDPIAEERRRADKKGDTDYAKNLSPKVRWIAWIIDRDNEDKGPQIWSMPPIMSDQINILIDDEDGDIIDIPHPENGYDVHFRREGSGVKSRYVGTKVARRPSPLSEDEDLVDEWLTFIHDNPLPDTLNFYSYDHIKAVLLGDVPDDPKESTNQVDDDEEEEEEEEEDESEDEEEEEDPKPRRKRPSVRAVEKDDDDEDDDSNEEDEEEEEDEDEDEDEEDENSSRQRKLEELRKRRQRK